MKPGEIQAIISCRAGEIEASIRRQAELDERLQFAEKAKQRFGYSALHDAVSKETVDTPADVVLLKALCDSGIIPLNRDSVLIYQKSMVGWDLNLFLKGFGFPLFFSGLLAAIIVVIATLKAHSGFADVLRVHWIWAAICGVGAAMLWVEHAVVVRKEWRRQGMKALFSWGGNALLPRGFLK